MYLKNANITYLIPYSMMFPKMYNFKISKNSQQKYIMNRTVNEMCCIIQKLSRRKAAKEHVRQKLQEHTGLTPQSVHSDQRADDPDAKTDDVFGFHDKTAKIKKCCVSFKLSSPGLRCSCSSVSAANANAGRNEGVVSDVLDVHDDNLLQSVNSENLQPQSHHVEPVDLVTREAVIKLDSKESNSNELTCSSVSLEHFAAVACSDADRQPDAHLCRKDVSVTHSVIATPENVYNSCDSEKSNSQEGSSLIVSSLNAAQTVRSSGVQNASATPVSAGDCDLNFSYMDEELLACFARSDTFPSDLHSPEKDISENVCGDGESDRIATVTGENVESRASSVIDDADDATTLCQALSAVKIAVAESVKSGTTDFTLPEPQYGEIIRLKVSNKASTVSKEENDVVEEMAHSRVSSSLSLPRSYQLSQSTHRLQQEQWYAAAFSALITTILSLINQVTVVFSQSQISSIHNIVLHNKLFINFLSSVIFVDHFVFIGFGPLTLLAGCRYEVLATNNTASSISKA